MYFIGIDVSTTATKALLMDAAGKVKAVVSSEYSYETPKPLWSEQNPALWWSAACKAIHGILQETGISGEKIAAVGLTGQMHGLVLLDKNGEVLRPAILWNDQRTQAECDEIHRIVGKEKFIQITGNVALTGFTAPKVLWVKNNEPEIYAQAAHILLPKDYVRLQLTGKFAMDKADGSGTVLMDLQKRDWSEEILAALDFPQNWLPQLYEGTQITGEITAEAAKVTGLLPGTPVVAGGGDQSAQAVGVGAVEEGIVALTLGTSGTVFATTDHAVIESQGKLHAFCHAIPQKWHLMGVMLSAAGSLRWYRDTFAPDEKFDDLLLPAAEMPVGCNGLLFLPYLTGERTPHPDPLARGAFVGLTVRHNRAHCTRAVLEGVAFGLRDSFELMKSAGLEKITQVRVSGGGAKSSLWLQILADVFQTELVTVNSLEGAAYGAAILAGVGAGQWNSVESACHKIVTVTSSILPDQETGNIYQKFYSVYQELYPALKHSFYRINEVL